MLEIFPIPAFQDNYIWMLSQDGHATVVDPGDATPVLITLKKNNLTLDSILITHHHSDHIGGVQPLYDQYQCQIFAPANNAYHFPNQSVHDGDIILLKHLNIDLQVIEVPGHTLDHIAYYGTNSLFCGDTLFSAGCGRLFEGSPQQMYDSLKKLASLPADTGVYCTHEYTQHNIKFAMQFDPENQDLIAYSNKVNALRLSGKPSLPSSIDTEKKINPFLRCDSDAIKHKLGMENMQPLDVFSKLRMMRNHY